MKGEIKRKFLKILSSWLLGLVGIYYITPGTKLQAQEDRIEIAEDKRIGSFDFKSTDDFSAIPIQKNLQTPILSQGISETPRPVIGSTQAIAAPEIKKLKGELEIITDKDREPEEFKLQNISEGGNADIIVALVTDLHENELSLISIKNGVETLLNRYPKPEKLILAFNGDWTHKLLKINEYDTLDKMRIIKGGHSNRLAFITHFIDWLKSLHDHNPTLEIVLTPGNNECKCREFVNEYFFNNAKNEITNLWKSNPNNSFWDLRIIDNFRYRLAGLRKFHLINALLNWEINRNTLLNLRNINNGKYGIMGMERIHLVSTISNWEINRSTRYKRFGNVVIVPYCTDNHCAPHCIRHDCAMDHCPEYHYKWAHGGDTDMVARAIDDGLGEVKREGIENPIVVILSHAGMPESENILLKAIGKSIGNIPTFLVVGHRHEYEYLNNGKRIQQSGDTVVDVTVIGPKAYGNSMPYIKIDTANPTGILMPSPFDNNN